MGAASGLSVLRKPTKPEYGAEATEPKVEVTLHKEASTWTAEFVVPHELLKTKGLCYVFWREGYYTENGRRIPFPAMDHYAISLDEFLKVPNKSLETNRR